MGTRILRTLVAGATVVAASIATQSHATVTATATTFTETFEDESNQSLTFSEPGEPTFSVDGDLMVEFFSALGSGGSDYWLGTGFGGGGNGTGGSALGSVGTISVASGSAFVVNSFDAWTGREDGNFHQPGRVTFVGTRPNATTASAIIDVTTVNDLDFVTGFSFAGTPLAGEALVSLEVFLTAELAPDTGNGTFDFLALDNLNLTTSPADTQAPTWSVPSDITTSTDPGQPTAVVTYSATASDNVGVTSSSCTPTSGSTFGLGTTTVNCTASDAAGNTGTDSFDVTVNDDEDPTWSVPADITTGTDPGQPTAVVNYVATPSDNVGVNGFSCTPASGSTFGLGTTTVNCTASDAAGNTGTASFDVTVNDDEDPTWSVPADIITSTDPGQSTAIVIYNSTASDNVNVTASSCTPGPGSAFGVGTTTVNCTASDPAGNTGTASFDVTVIDGEDPVVSVPADITAEATGPSGAPVDFSATATDNVDGVLTPSCTPGSGATFNLGTTQVDCSATDSAGNTGTASFEVTVEDTTAPVPPAGPADVLVQCAVDVPPPVDLTATDAVDGSITVSPSVVITPGASANDFVMVRTWTFTDAAGNSSQVSQTITVFDSLAPAAPAAPGDVTVFRAADIPAPVDLTATDNCDGPITVSPVDQVVGNVTTRTWTFTDNNGNTSQVQQTITVADAVAVMVVGAVPANTQDAVIKTLLEAQGFTVVLIDDDTTDLAAAVSAENPNVIVVPSSVLPSKVNTQLAALAIPVVVSEPFLFDDFGLTAGGSGNQGETGSKNSIRVLNSTHPITAPFSGNVVVTTSDRPLSFGKPAGDVESLANEPGSSTRSVIMVADQGDALATGAAPAPRVGLFLSYSTPTRLTDDGASIFGKAVSYASNFVPPDPNVEPVVDAGPDQTIMLPTNTVAIDATVTDDNSILPTPTITWTGPAGVTFNPADTVDTTVTLPGAGTYTLRITADDGQFQVFDEVMVTVISSDPVGNDILYVVGNAASLSNNDQSMLDRLVAAGLNVTIVDDDNLATANTASADGVVISSSVITTKIGNFFTALAKPILTWEGYLLDDLGLTTGSHGETPETTRAITVTNAAHPLAAGLSGTTTVLSSAQKLNYATPGPGATNIAHQPGKSARSVLFTYEAGAALPTGGAAPARRVAIFPNFQGTGSLNGNGGLLVDQAINYLLS